jgi:hypothetical protein
MEVLDMVANLAGAFAGLLIYKFLDRKYKALHVRL